MFQSRFGLRFSVSAAMGALVGALGFASAAAAATNAFAYRSPRYGQGRRTIHTWHKSFSRCGSIPGGGPLERATRRRQIADGQLREQNGLWLEAAA